MELSELRINNLVKVRMPKFTHFINPALVTADKMIQLIEGKLKFAPIPLTVDELLLLGFEKCERLQDDDFDRYSIHTKPYEKLGTHFTVKINGDGMPFWTYVVSGITPCDEHLLFLTHVHCLQNLFFMLHGVEITYEKYRPAMIKEIKMINILQS